MTGVTHQADSERPECLLVTLGEAGEVEGGESVLVPGVSTAQDGATRPLLYPLQLSLLCEGKGGGPGGRRIHQLGQDEGRVD